MCLPDFLRFEQIDKDSPIIGYRDWRNPIKDSNTLISQYTDYCWKELEGPHEVLDEDSGIYSYNYYNNIDNNNNNYNYNYNNYINYNYNNYNNIDNNNYNYNIVGIIKQYGKTAVHKTGYRSEYAIIDTLFSIRRLDAKGPQRLLDWIEIFNKRIEDIAKEYKCKVVTHQDFIDSMKRVKK